MIKLIKRLPPALLVLLLASLPHLIYVLSKWHAIPLQDGIPIGPTDPDPWLRLTLVREWLTSGDWYNHVVRHANTPFAEPVSPWARPLDLVIATLVKLQPSDVDLSLRLMRAALLLPWIWMTLLLAGIFRILRCISPAPASYLMATFFVAMMPIIWNYFGLANADHHAPLAVLFMWALGGVLNPAPTRPTMVITGILLGIMLWMSMEAAILIGVIYIWYGLNWLRGNATAASYLSILSTSVAFTALIALMIERPVEHWFTPVYDANSIVYVLLLTLAALIAWQLTFTRSPSIITRFLTCTLSAVIAMGFFFTVFPLALHGPMAEVTPFVIHDFLPRISEVKPLYTNDPLVIIATCLQPFAAFFMLFAAWKLPRQRFFLPREVSALTYFTIILFIMYVGQQRWGYYAFPILALTLGPVLAALFEPKHPAFANRWPAIAMLRLNERSQMLRRLPIVVLIVGLPLALMLLNGYTDKQFGNAAERTLHERRDFCYNQARIAIRSGALSHIEVKNSVSILAPTDLGTEILFFTQHHIVASNYHREGEAIEYVWKADKITDPEKLRAHLAERKIAALLICPAIEQPTDSILQGIANGNEPPVWLTPVPLTITAPSTKPSTPPPAHAAPKLFLTSSE